jgi:Na+/melibiose symporter-like transporter
MSIWKKILVAALMSWGYSVTLGLLFAIILSENHSARDLLLPGVIPTTLVGSTAVAIVITPMAIWSTRTGPRNLWLYGPILWAVLAAYIVFTIPRTGHYGLYGLLCIAVMGLAVLGIIPRR